MARSKKKSNVIVLNALEIDVPTYDQIALRAYEIYERRGRVDGFDKEDWLQAEEELCAEYLS